MPGEDEAGISYRQLISDQLAEERNRKASLESRGITVITTSGTLVTLLFGLTAALTAASGFKMPEAAKLPLLFTLVSFVAAAVFGLATNVPLGYQEATPQGLARLVDSKFWAAPAALGQLRVAGAEVVIISATRSANNLKARLLTAAVAAELFAIIFLSVAVAIILYSR